jgi:hypothetical protein
LWFGLFEEINLRSTTHFGGLTAVDGLSKGVEEMGDWLSVRRAYKKFGNEVCPRFGKEAKKGCCALAEID